MIYIFKKTNNLFSDDDDNFEEEKKKPAKKQSDNAFSDSENEEEEERKEEAAEPVKMPKALDFASELSSKLASKKKNTSNEEQDNNNEAHKNTVINSSRVKRKREAGFHLCYSFLSIFLLLYLGVADVAVVVRLFPSFQIKISRETAFFSWLLWPGHSVMGKPNKRVFTRARLYEPALQIGLGFQSFLFKLHDGTKTAGPPTQYQANKSLILQEKGAAISTHRSGSI